MRAEETYRSLLRIYPASFRDQFGGEMMQLFRDVNKFHQGSRFALWARTISDLLVSGLFERKESMMSKANMPTAVLFGALVVALLFTGSLVGVGGELVPALLLFGVLVAVALTLVGIAALIGRRLQGPTERIGRRLSRWWIPAPVLIAAFYLFVGGREVSVEPDLGDLVGISFIAFFVGLIAVGLLLRYRRVDNLGNWLTIVGSLPALGAFWFPPVPIVGLVSIVGALSDVFASRKRPTLETSG